MSSSSKLLICSISTFFTLFVIFQIQSTPPQNTSPWAYFKQWGTNVNRSSCPSTGEDHGQQELEIEVMASRLGEAVTFLPLKDLRYAKKPLEGHTWFMSSLNDTGEAGETQHLRFPSEASDGRVLCLKGQNTGDGSWNSYALAWPGSLPNKATLLKGGAYVSYNEYTYDNIWHGMSTLMPFVWWYIKSQCRGPERWILYHKGELRTRMAPWVTTLFAATFDGQLHIEDFSSVYGNESDSNYDSSACFEEAVVMRHNEGKMSMETRRQVYDMMRCKARMYCNMSSEEKSDKSGIKIGMTLLMRTGARSFVDSSAVVGIFDKACREVEGCRLTVAYSNNLTFCEQVKLMSLTDVMVTPHGAQLSNMIFMDRNSSVMEFFPNGWLEHAGVGQYIYQWLASWAGMKHQGVWRDSAGDGSCPSPEDVSSCMSVLKQRKIGHNESYFLEWAGRVLGKVRRRKVETNSSTASGSPVSGLCGCK